MSRNLFGIGCFGPLIFRAQEGLHRTGIELGRIDGIYGRKTEAAVKIFSQRENLPEEVGITGTCWNRLLHEEPPDLFARCLQLTASFEWTAFRGQNPYGCVVGNFDGQGITWGIIGFTLKGGEIAEVINRVTENNPSLLSTIAGDNWETLRNVLHSSTSEREQWGDSISAGNSKQKVKEPWASLFRRFGEQEMVQAAQRSMAIEQYWRPALRSASLLNMQNELSLALCFDIHVQNGNATRAKRRLEKYQDHCERDHPQTESERRAILADIIIDGCNPKWRDNVRSRKWLFVEGSGEHNGLEYELEKWGLMDVEG